jgi:hypothetical protein
MQRYITRFKPPPYKVLRAAVLEKRIHLAKEADVMTKSCMDSSEGLIRPTLHITHVRRGLLITKAVLSGYVSLYPGLGIFWSYMA